MQSYGVVVRHLSKILLTLVVCRELHGYMDMRLVTSVPGFWPTDWADCVTNCTSHAVEICRRRPYMFVHLGVFWWLYACDIYDNTALGHFADGRHTMLIMWCCGNMLHCTSLYMRVACCKLRTHTITLFYLLNVNSVIPFARCLHLVCLAYLQWQ